MNKENLLGSSANSSGDTDIKGAQRTKTAGRKPEDQRNHPNDVGGQFGYTAKYSVHLDGELEYLHGSSSDAESHDCIAEGGVPGQAGATSESSEVEAQGKDERTDKGKLSRKARKAIRKFLRH